MPPKMKTCTKCKEEYLATTEYFAPNRHTKDGLQSWCRKCHREATRVWYQTNKRGRRKYNRAYRDLHRSESRVYQSEYYKTFPGYVIHLVNHMRTRCCNPKCTGYRYWGGRGIILEFTTQELMVWLSEQDIDPRGLDIHRKDNDKNYTLDNIEFLTHSEHITLHNRLRSTENAT